MRGPMFPPIAQEARVSPMPKSICSAGQYLRALSATSKGAVLTDLDPTSLSLIRQVRGLPNVHRLQVAPDGFTLGYTQKHAKGYPSELHFIDPELRLAKTVFASNSCTSFASHCGDWLVACRDGCVYCFSNVGDQRWMWRVPREGHFEFAWLTVAADSNVILANTQLRTWLGTSAGLVLWTRSRMNTCAKHIAVCRSRNRSGNGGYLAGRASDPLQLGLQVPCHRSLGSLARQRCSKTIQRRRGDSGDRRCRTFHDGRDHTGWRVALKGALTHVACAEGRDDFVGSQTSPGRERHKSDSA